MLNKRIFFILFLLIIAFGLMSSVNATDLADNQTADEIGIQDDLNVEDLEITDTDETISTPGDEDVLGAGTFSSLQSKINSASEGSTINLYDDYTYNTNFGSTDGVTITKSITINGNGHTINGASKSSIFLIYGAENVVLNNIVFKNAYCSDGNGGAIYTLGSDVTIESCEFDNNFALNGGSIFSAYSNVTVRDSSFSNADIVGVGGAIMSVNSVLICLNTEFANNYAMTAGGDIYSNNGTLFLFGSNFAGSSSDDIGGSIYSEEDYMQVFGCSFEDCRSLEDAGGAIYCLNSILTSNSTVFNSCHAAFGGAICSLNTLLEIDGSDFQGCDAVWYGGSVYSIYGTVDVKNSLFFLSGGFYGGAMFVRSPSEISITDNKFLYSYAEVGPRIYIDEYYADVPQSGNIYEDIYFVVGEFNGSTINDDVYLEHSNILTYIISNTNEHQADDSFYDDLIDDFISRMEFGSSDEIEVSIYDVDYPADSIIFLNYADMNDHRIVYDSHHTLDELNLRTLDINFYNFEGSRRISLNVLSGSFDMDFGSGSGDYCNLYFSDNNTDNKWWTIPVFDDPSRIRQATEDETQYWIEPLYDYEFNQKRIDGKLIFNFQDRLLFSNFGNVYSFKSFYSLVPIIDSQEPATNLPSRYDSRDYDYITPVKDQSIGGNCWAFAGIATLEACLKKATGIEYDFSEDNAKNLMAISSIYGWNISANNGGFHSMFQAYLTSWLGPLHDMYDTYNPLSALSVVGPSVYHIQDIDFIPVRKNTQDNDEYKKAIMNNGAVAVMIEWYDYDEGDFARHAITLVGWDDNYKGKDFIGNTARGAWIFKNSWGPDWANNGYGYLSYEQALSTEVYKDWGSYTFSFHENSGAYQDIYQYDFAGVTNYMIFEDKNYNQVYYKNKFTAKDDEFLSAFSTYFEHETNFTYSIRINGKEITKTDYGEPIISSVHSCSPGYHTIPLGYDLELKKGDEFEIIIKLLNPKEDSIPVCQADDLYKTSYPSGVSYVSFNGNTWYDLYDLDFYQDFRWGPNKRHSCQIACLKAFTNNWRMNSTENDPYIQVSSGTIIGTPGGSFLNYNFDIYGFDVELAREENCIIFYLYDWDTDNNDYENFVKATINDEVYYVPIFDEGYAVLEFDLSQDKFYRLSAVSKSNHYMTFELEYNFMGGDTVYESFTDLQEMIDDADDGDTIQLDSNFFFDDEFFENYDSLEINKSITIDGQGHILNGFEMSYILKVFAGCDVTLKNIHFINANSTTYGAIASYGNLNVYKCNFTDNNAVWGGAIYSSGEVTIENSIFNSNSAYWGGAVCSEVTVTIKDSVFKSNSATVGGAVFSNGECDVINSQFISNSADYGGAIASKNDLDVSKSTFKNNKATVSGGAVYVEGEGLIKNSDFESNSAKYGGAIVSFGYSDLTIKGSTFTSNEASSMGGSVSAENNLDISNSNFKTAQDNMEIIYYSYKFDENGTAYGELKLNNNRMDTKNAPAIFYDGGGVPYGLPLYLVFTNIKAIKGEYVKLCQIKDADGNTIGIAEIEVVLTNQNDKSKVTSMTLQFDYDKGMFGFDTSLLEYGAYQITGSVSDEYATDCRVTSGMLYVVERSSITSSGLNKVYGDSNGLVVTFKDGSGRVIANANLKVSLNGNTFNVVTDANGKAIIPVNLAPNTYLATITYEGNEYSSSSITASIVVKKATPKITAKKKTYKLKAKKKKYSITLKDNLGRAIKGAKVTVKIKKKTFRATTNAKGKATFKLKLTKKGKYWATIKYAGNAYYNAATKKVKITVKK